MLEVDASPPHASLKGRSPPSPGAPRRSSGGIEHMPSQVRAASRQRAGTARLCIACGR